MSCFHKLLDRAYGNKLKTAYENLISCFNKFSHRSA